MSETVYRVELTDDDRLALDNVAGLAEERANESEYHGADVRGYRRMIRAVRDILDRAAPVGTEAVA